MVGRPHVVLVIIISVVWIVIEADPGDSARRYSHGSEQGSGDTSEIVALPPAFQEDVIAPTHIVLAQVIAVLACRLGDCRGQSEYMPVVAVDI